MPLAQFLPEHFLPALPQPAKSKSIGAEFGGWDVSPEQQINLQPMCWLGADPGHDLEGTVTVCEH